MIDCWKVKLTHWQNVTKVEKKNQASAIILSLSDEAAVEACLDISMDELTVDDGVKKLLETLDGLYLKDELLQSIDAYANFESFVRPADQKISDYKIEFDRRYNKAKKYGMMVISCLALQYK